MGINSILKLSTLLLLSGLITSCATNETVNSGNYKLDAMVDWEDDPELAITQLIAKSEAALSVCLDVSPEQRSAITKSIANLNTLLVETYGGPEHERRRYEHRQYIRRASSAYAVQMRKHHCQELLNQIEKWRER